MKTFIGAVLSFFLIVLGVQFYTHKVNHACDSLSATANQIKQSALEENWSGCKKGLDTFRVSWDSTHSWFSFFLYHKDINSVDETLKELEIYITCQSRERTAVTANVLSEFIRQLPDAERLTLENIF